MERAREEERMRERESERGRKNELTDIHRHRNLCL